MPADTRTTTRTTTRTITGSITRTATHTTSRFTPYITRTTTNITTRTTTYPTPGTKRTTTNTTIRKKTRPSRAGRAFKPRARRPDPTPKPRSRRPDPVPTTSSALQESNRLYEAHLAQRQQQTCKRCFQVKPAGAPGLYTCPNPDCTKLFCRSCKDSAATIPGCCPFCRHPLDDTTLHAPSWRRNSHGRLAR